MVMRSLYRASGALVGRVGARSGERSAGSQYVGRRVAPAQEEVPQAHRGAFAAAAQDRREPAPAGFETPRSLGRLRERSGDGRRGQIARHALLEELLPETAAADAAAASA